MGAVLHGGKTAQDGAVQRVGSLRHANPLMCFHGNMARYLWWRFWFNGESFPDHAAANFLARCLWKGKANEVKDNMCYRTFSDRMQQYMQQAGINCREVTHLCRKLSARELDSSPGVDTRVRFVHWHACIFCCCDCLICIHSDTRVQGACI